MKPKVYTIFATKLTPANEGTFRFDENTYRAKDSRLWLIAWEGDLLNPPENAAHNFNYAKSRLKCEIEENPNVEKIEIRYHYFEQSLTKCTVDAQRVNLGEADDPNGWL